MFAFRNDTWGQSFVAETGLQANATLADLASGLVAGTQVATQMGWRDVGAVMVGDQVLTFDSGMQTVASVTRTTLTTDGDFAPADSWPLFVPAGALGNRDEMILLPKQAVMIEADAAEDLLGDPFALIPALALEGFRGITRIPPAATFDIVTLAFAEDQVVFANTGALIFCLASTDLLLAALSEYAPVNVAVAALLVEAMTLTDTKACHYEAAA